MIIDIISDLHGFYPKLEGGDLLILAGDLTATHTKSEYTKFANWYLAQSYQKKILIPGNHDTLIENGDFYFNHEWMGYLCDSGTEFCGTDKEGKKRTTKIYGSPWTKTFPGMNSNCKAFTLETEKELDEKWKLIPNDVNILITHSPPFGVFDSVTSPSHECEGF